MRVPVTFSTMPMPSVSHWQRKKETFTGSADFIHETVAFCTPLRIRHPLDFSCISWSWQKMASCHQDWSAWEDFGIPKVSYANLIRLVEKNTNHQWQSGSWPLEITRGCNYSNSNGLKTCHDYCGSSHVVSLSIWSLISKNCVVTRAFFTRPDFWLFLEILFN